MTPAVDRRTPLERARAELVGNLAGADAFTLAAVLYFVDSMRDSLRRSAADYSPLMLAYGRVASEVETAARAAGIPLPVTEDLASVMGPAPVPVDETVDRDLDAMADIDAERLRNRRRLNRLILKAREGRL
jgi:hypothetical protein